MWLNSHHVPHSNQISFRVMYFRKGVDLLFLSRFAVEATGKVRSGYEGIIQFHYPVADMRSRNRSSQNTDIDSHHNTSRKDRLDWSFRDEDAPPHTQSLSKRLRKRRLSKGQLHAAIYHSQLPDYHIYPNYLHRRSNFFSSTKCYSGYGPSQFVHKQQQHLHPTSLSRHLYTRIHSMRQSGFILALRTSPD